MTMLPRPLTRLTDATLADGRRVDVEITGDTVTGVHPAGTLGGARKGGVRESGAGTDPAAHLDLDGFLLLTAPAEPHAHLDKALSWDLIQPPMGDLGLAIDSWKRYAAEMTTEGIADRARRQALAML